MTKAEREVPTSEWVGSKRLQLGNGKLRKGIPGTPLKINKY